MPNEKVSVNSGEEILAVLKSLPSESQKLLYAFALGLEAEARNPNVSAEDTREAS